MQYLYETLSQTSLDNYVYKGSGLSGIVSIILNPL